VKLATEATYRIDVSFKPPRSLDALRVLGEPADAQERSRDGTACAYSSYWNTNALAASRRGERTQLVIAMQVLIGH
jgi:CB1 cannabinoid receptor-interacting protein 1